MKLTLLQKGFLLVSIPLCFEMTIFVQLLNLQNQAELEAQRVNKHKQINDSLNFILRKVLTLGKLPTTEFVTPSFNDHMEQIFIYLERLKELTRGEPALYKNVLGCESSMNAAKHDLLLLRQMLKTGEPADRNEVYKGRTRLFRDVDDAIGADFLELADKSSQGVETDRSKELRERIKMLLFYAVGLSVIIGFLSATIFSRHLVSRLQKLGINAANLAKGEPLVPVEKGIDEVTELDQSFHYAADEIAKATTMRREVTAMIAHDLKTPLQSITSLLEMLHHGMLIRLNTHGRDLLSVSEKESVRMNALIDSVLKLEQLRGGHIKLLIDGTDLIPIIEESVTATKDQAATKRVELKREYGQLVKARVLADKRWLQTALANILSHAIASSPPNSTVIIFLQSSSDDLTISISDRGPGVAESERELIFERFLESSGDGQISGTGLGLAIARELIELNRGTVGVASKSRVGCTYTVRLPRPV